MQCDVTLLIQSESRKGKPVAYCLDLEAVSGETEKKRKKRRILWMHDVFVSGCNEVEFHTLFQRPRKVEVLTGRGLGLDVVARIIFGSDLIKMIAITRYICLFRQFFLHKGKLSHDRRCLKQRHFYSVLFNNLFNVCCIYTLRYIKTR
jgi:hypothetical protein